MRLGLVTLCPARCSTKYQMSQSRYYRWREQFLARATHAFESRQHIRPVGVGSWRCQAESPLSAQGEAVRVHRSWPLTIRRIPG